MASLEFSEEHLRVLNDALVQLPFWRAAPLIELINQQLAAQRQGSTAIQQTQARVAELEGNA